MNSEKIYVALAASLLLASLLVGFLLTVPLLVGFLLTAFLREGQL